MSTNWNARLRSLGFSESETHVYLASLELGEASVQDVAKRANVSRVTAYAVIEHLIKQGLMSSVEKGKKRYVVAESPDRLLASMKTRLTQMQTSLREAEDALQELKLVQRGEKPVVRLYEGEEAFQAIFRDLAKTKVDQIEEFGNHDILRRHVTPQMFEKHVAPHLKSAKNRAIMTSSVKTAPTTSNGSVVYISAKDHSCHGDILIYGKEKVAFSTFGPKPVSVLIESETVAEMMRSLFSLAWKQVKK
jgi:sugar-specific transcriptional regulator TrmB